MGGERLSSLCLISVERDLSYDMMQNPEIMIDDLAKKENIREHYFTVMNRLSSLLSKTADYYVDTKNFKPFIRIFNFFDCSNQTGTTSVRNKIFLFCKMLF